MIEGRLEDSASRLSADETTDWKPNPVQLGNSNRRWTQMNTDIRPVERAFDRFLAGSIHAFRSELYQQPILEIRLEFAGIFWEQTSRYSCNRISS